MEARVATFKTGHGVFDHISQIAQGSIILVLDEGHYESLRFLSVLLKQAQEKIPVKALTLHSLPSNLSQISVISAKTLSDLSITVSKLREDMGHGILIHHYLPYFLIHHDENNLLKYIGHWSSQIQNKPFLEFFTLPKGSFPSFERKLQSLVQGTIILTYEKLGENYASKLSIFKACKPEYHGKDFYYLIKDDRLLIKLEDEFVETIPTSLEDKLAAKINYIVNNLNSLKIEEQIKAVNKLDPVDYLLLSQIAGMPLTDVKVLFWDKFDEILRKIALWSALEIIKLSKTPEQKEIKVQERMKRSSKLALIYPVSIASSLFLGGRPRYVPIEALLGLRRSIETILRTYLEDEGDKAAEMLQTVEKLVHEIAARVTTLKRLEKIGESPSGRVGFKYLPKCAALTLHIGFGLKCKIRNKTKSSFDVVVEECFECEGVRSNKPACIMIEGSLKGSLSFVFKETLLVEETACKAMGDKACIFSVKANPA